MTSASGTVTRIPIRTITSGFEETWTLTIPAVYAAAPKKAAWPNDSSSV